MKDLIRKYKALSDSTRLRIINLLLERECCVCEVMEALDISQTRASRNLNILYNAGFLKARREGAWMYYSIDDEGLTENSNRLLDILRANLETDRVAIRDREKLSEIARAGVVCHIPSIN